MKNTRVLMHDMDKNRRKKILVCPLDWGLGHAARMSVVIKVLLERGYEIILAGSGHSLGFLKSEFPNLKFESLPPYNIKYSTRVPFAIKIAFQIPKILRAIRSEHKILKEIITKHQPCLIISDNRYGLYSEKVPSIFVTHQLFPILNKPFEFLQKKFHKRLHAQIKNFDLCMIPDNENFPDLTGKLSHGKQCAFRTFYSGPLMRFSPASGEKPHYIYSIAAILSGPEPERSILEKKIKEQSRLIKEKILIVGGKAGSNTIRQFDTYDYVDFLNSGEIEKLILNVPVIISRSGYTSIMDYAGIRKTALIIPTPGQTEQEYLAEYLHKRKMFFSVNQKDINLSKHFCEFANFQAKFYTFTFDEKRFLEITNELISKKEQII